LLRNELQRVAAERDDFLQERNDIQTTLDARIEAATAGGTCENGAIPYFVCHTSDEQAATKQST
jgi:hypothetical protein